MGVTFRRDSLGPLAAVRNGSLCMRAWLRAEVLRLVVMLVVLFQLAWPWGVAVSRWGAAGNIVLGARDTTVWQQQQKQRRWQHSFCRAAIAVQLARIATE